MTPKLASTKLIPLVDRQLLWKRTTFLNSDAMILTGTILLLKVYQECSEAYSTSLQFDRLGICRTSKLKVQKLAKPGRRQIKIYLGKCSLEQQTQNLFGNP